MAFGSGSGTAQGSTAGGAGLATGPGKVLAPTPKPGPGGTLGSLTGDQRNAYDALVDLFNGYGLGTLAPKIFTYIKNGFGADTISLLLQDTTEYKQRFAGNELRKKAGLPVLSPAEYLATEKAYRQVLQDAGMPTTFYDSPQDFSAWIGGDVSATEIQGRVQLAVQDGAQAPDYVKQALQDEYGIGPNDITAYFLDRTRALPLLQIQAAAAQIGGAALAHGFRATPAASAEQLAAQGITAAQAQAGYGQLAETFDPMQAIAQRFGTTWNLNEAEQDVFNPGAHLGAEDVTKKRTDLQSQERALFSGTAGAISYQGLAPRQQQE